MEVVLWKNIILLLKFFVFLIFNGFMTWPPVWPPISSLVTIYRPFTIIFLEATYNSSQKIHMAISPSIINTYPNFDLVYKVLAQKAKAYVYWKRKEQEHNGCATRHITVGGEVYWDGVNIEKLLISRCFLFFLLFCYVFSFCLFFND